MLGILRTLGKCVGDFDELIMYNCSSDYFPIARFGFVKCASYCIKAGLPHTALRQVFLVLSDETVLQRSPKYFLMFCIYGRRVLCSWGSVLVLLNDVTAFGALVLITCLSRRSTCWVTSVVCPTEYIYPRMYMGYIHTPCSANL